VKHELRTPKAVTTSSHKMRDTTELSNKTKFKAQVPTQSHQGMGGFHSLIYPVELRVVPSSNCVPFPKFTGIQFVYVRRIGI
jgi:hypothetical protein